MSKYVLVYLPRGEIEKYHSNLVNIVGPKFGENYLIENPRPSHVTLKEPFVIKDILPIEKFLEIFVKKYLSSNIEIEGFANFNRFVVFLNTKFSEEGMELQKQLISELGNFEEMEFGKFELEWHPHLTVSYANSPENFEKIATYLEGLPSPKFEVKFDNIAILEKVNNLWEIHKIFEIK